MRTQATSVNYTPAMEQPAPTVRVRTAQGRSTATRQKILDAAIVALVEGGYSGATTLRIQQLAGVSRGRLLHHYPSRDDVLVAAVAHLTEARMRDLADDVQWPDDPEARIDKIIETTWITFRQPYFWASTELWLAARSNPRLREALLPHERRIGSFISAKMRDFFGPELVAHPNYAVAKDVLVSSMRGFALTFAFRDYSSEADSEQISQWKTTTRALLGIEPLCQSPIR
ncbi:hypothetical protein BH09ACT6_BH09ACT6_07140 [soil metagenome]